jgi:preprotein translocase subunit SecE
MKLINYFKDVKAELAHVSWPSKKQVVLFTTLVVVLSLLTALYLGVFDFVFSQGAKGLLKFKGL